MIFSDRAPITDSQNGMGAIKKSLGKLALMDYRKKWTIGKNIVQHLISPICLIRSKVYVRDMIITQS